MAVDEVRKRLRRKLEEVVGVDETDLLLDRPPGGWSELVTKDWLHLEVAAIESRLAGLESRLAGLEQRLDRQDGRFAAIDTRLRSIDQEIHAQTWKLVAAMTGLFAAFVAAIKL